MKRNLWAGFALLALVAMLTSFVAPAQAAVRPVSSAVNGEPIGLIVHLAPMPASARETAKAGVLSSLHLYGLTARFGKSIGRGWNSIAFSGVANPSQITEAMRQVAGVSGVIGVSPDRAIRVAAASSATRASTTRFSAAVKPASAPATLFATDNWQSSAPSQAELKLRWTKPKSLFGAKVIGYRVYSKTATDAGWVTLDSQTAATTTSLVIRSFAAGVPVSFKVAAVTKLSSKTRVGTLSKVVTATATTAPKPPVFVGSRLASTTTSPNWYEQSLTDRGGLPVTYTAVATAAGYPSVTCQTTKTSCPFADLQAGVTYRVSLSAANARGKADTVAFKAVADPDYDLQWALTSKYGIQVEGAWDRTRGANTLVAVLDTGYSVHPDLNNQYLKATDGSVYGYDFVSPDSEPGDGDGWDANALDTDPGTDWHGTHVSGIIAAEANDQGTIGVAPESKLLEVRVLGAKGGTGSDLIAALNWTAGIDVPNTPKNIHPAQVINLSLGLMTGSLCDSATEAALLAVYKLNITVVTAAGNDGGSSVLSYPGNCYPSINVGASDYNGGRPSYGNYGEATNIAAPGGSRGSIDGSTDPNSQLIYSTGQDGTPANPTPTYFYMGGTSQAAPMVSGVAALMYSIKPDITPIQVWEAMSKTVTPFPAGGECALADKYHSCGAGILNAAAALDYVAAGKFTGVGN